MNYLRMLFATAISFVFSVALANADDREGQLVQYVNQSSPSYFSLDRSSLQFKDFPGTNGGRLSVIGEYTLTTDFVEVVDGFVNLSQALQAKGYTVAEIREAFETLNIFRPFGAVSIVELRVVHQRGEAFSFSGELPYIETVSGISISGRINSSRPNGRALNSIQGNYYVVGTSSFDQQLNRVAMVIDGMRSRESSAVTALRSALDEKMWFYNYARTNDDRRAQEILAINFDFTSENFNYSSWFPVSIFPRPLGSASTPKGNGTVISGIAKATSQYRLASGFTMQAGTEYQVDLTVGLPTGSDSLEDVLAILGVNAGNQWHEIGRFRRVPTGGSSDAYFETSFPKNGQALIKSSDFQPSAMRCRGAGASLDTCERVLLKWWSIYERRWPNYAACIVWDTLGDSYATPLFRKNDTTRSWELWSNGLSGGVYGKIVELSVIRSGETFNGYTCS